MFKPSAATTIQEYIDLVPAERRDAIVFLHNFIQQNAPSLKPHFANGMPSYGSFPYRNAKKEMVDWPVILLANQKNYISVYVCSTKDGKYLAETHQKELGKVSVGKSCVRFKKLEDLDLEGFRKLLKLAEQNPGMVLKR